MINLAKLTAVLALSGSVITFATVSSFAGAKYYEFQLVNGETKQGDGAIISVRLIDKRTNKPVPDAVIFQTRLDMSPEGMETMTTPVTASPVTEPGVYGFKANIAMAGGWQLSLAAKVQGETETVQGKLVLKAKP